MIVAISLSECARKLTMETAMPAVSFSIYNILSLLKLFFYAWHCDYLFSTGWELCLWILKTFFNLLRGKFTFFMFLFYFSYSMAPFCKLIETNLYVVQPALLNFFRADNDHDLCIYNKNQDLAEISNFMLYG